MLKGVAFLWPIFREEAVAQRIIAHNVLDLQGSRQSDSSPSAITHVLIQPLNKHQTT